MAFLKVIVGDNPGQSYKLEGSRMVIGRHPTCEIVLDNAAVSRHHAQILENLGSYFLEDMRSRNRTQFYRNRTTAGPDASNVVIACFSDAKLTPSRRR